MTQSLFPEGPRQSPFKFDLRIDNKTRTDVDLGELGGQTKATAEIRGNSLITYIHNKDTGVLFLTATRTVDLSNPDKMIYTTRHLPSNVALISTFNRKN